MQKTARHDSGRTGKETNAGIAGCKILGVQQIRIVDILGKLLQAVAELDGHSTREINRLLEIAASTMASLNRLGDVTAS